MMKVYINKIAALSLSVLLMLSAMAAKASVPEPDNLVYGTFTLNSVPVTATDTNISLEIVVQGNVIASYAMGDNADINDRYLLTVPLDTVGPRSNTIARPGDSAIIRYNDNGAITNLDSLILGERGTTTQLDLTATIAQIDDADADGIADSLDNDDDNDGVVDAIELALGTDPLVAEGTGPGGIYLDTDLDGLPDFIETNLTLTDPLVADIAENTCTPKADGLSGQWDLRITDRRTVPELADSQYSSNYPTTAPADVRLDAESLIGLSICHEDSDLRAWAVGLGYAQVDAFTGDSLILSWGATANLSVGLHDVGKVFSQDPLEPSLMIGSWTQGGSAHSLRMERRALLDNSLNISGIYAAQRGYLDPLSGSNALGPMGDVISSHTELVQTAPGDVHITIYDDQGRAMPAFYIPSIGAVISAAGINTEVDTTGDTVSDSLTREVSFYTGLFVESPVSSGGMLRGEWSQTVDLDLGNDGPGIGDTSYQVETAFYAKSTSVRAKVQTVNEQETGYYSEAVLNNVPTSSKTINLRPPFSTDIGEGYGISMTVASNTDMGDQVRIHNRLPAFVDGEQVGRANDGASLDVSELTFAGTPGTLFGAGTFRFSTDPVSSTTSSAYTPVAVPGELLPVVDTNAVMLDGVAINTGEVNAARVYGLASHSLTWNRVTSGGRLGGGAGAYRVSFSTKDGSLFSLIGADQFHIDVDGATACNVTTSVCEITIEPFTLGADPLDLVMTIEAVDATDPLNLSRTAGFHLALNSDDIDGDGLTDSQETALGTNPLLADTDSDGLDDYSELNRDGDPLTYLVGVDTDPKLADTDGDGLNDFTELDMDGDPSTYLVGVDTDPNDADTDGDGLDDFTELDMDGDPLTYLVGVDTDPNDADTDGDGLDDFTEVNMDGNPLTYLVGVDTDPNNADTDADGLPDGIDPDPLVPNSSAPYDGDLAPLGAPDGVVNVADVLIAQRITLGLITPTQLQLDHGDVYPVGAPDGVINISDLLLIQKMVLQ